MSIHEKAQAYIKSLCMQSHPEGGYFVSSYRHSMLCHPEEGLDPRSRALCTCIYYLLPSGQYSSWHTLLSDELWFFHDGCPISIHCFFPDGQYKQIHLGLIGEGQTHMAPMACIPANSTFGAEPDLQDSFTLVSCVVIPGFDFADFAFADTAHLIRSFPGHTELIRRLGRYTD